MADPVTWAAIGTAASVAAAGVGIASSIGGAATGAAAAKQSGEAKATQFEYQAGIAQRNKQIAKQNADYARWTGELEAQKSGMKTGWEMSLAKTAQGASGLDVNFGSATQVRDSMHEIGWHDQQVIRSNAARTAYAYESEGAIQQTQSEMYKKAATDSRAGADLGVAASILGGASSVSSKWMQGSTMGLWGGGSNTSTHNSGVGLDYA